MNATSQPKGIGTPLDVIKRVLLALFSTSVQAAILFGAAGRLDWGMAWVLTGVYLANAIALMVFIEPELISERARPKEEAATWDRLLAGLVKLLVTISWVICGLDMRWEWTQQIPLAVQIAGVVVITAGYALGAWATTVNQFFSNIVRIQTERGHVVVSDGPYRYIRHPGYAGSILLVLLTPVALDSLWALIPCGLAVVLFIVRLVYEDRFLHEELDGYKEYAGRVRYRLVPGIW